MSTIQLGSDQPLHSASASFSVSSSQNTGLMTHFLTSLDDSSPACTSVTATVFRREVMIIGELVQAVNLASLFPWAEIYPQYGDIVTYSRLDVVLQTFLGSFWTLVVMAAVVAFPLLVLTINTLRILKIRPLLLRVIVYGGGWVSSTVALIPLCYLFMGCLWVNYWGCLYVLTILLVSAYRVCMCDVQWLSVCIFAGLDTSTSLIDLAVNQLLVFNFLLFPDFTWHSTCFRLLCSVYLSYSYLTKQPYYSPLVNTCFALKYLLFAWLAVVLQLSFTLQMRDVLPLFGLFGSLALGIVVAGTVRMWFKDVSVKNKAVQELISLKTTSNTEEIEAFFERMKKNSKFVEIFILESLFYVWNRQKSKGRLRLLPWIHTKIPLKYKFIVWKLRKKLYKNKDFSRKSQNQSEYFYHKDCLEAMEWDFLACTEWRRYLWQYAHNANNAELFEQMRKVTEVVSRAKRGYQRLVDCYPGRKVPLQLQSCFRSLVSDSSSSPTTLLANIDSPPLMLISASQTTPGKVLFMNPQCSELLDREVTDTEDLYLSSFFPANFSLDDHDEALGRHVHTADTEHFSHDRVFLITQFPVVGLQVRVNAWIASNEADVYYETTLRSLTAKNEEFALISRENGILQVRSKFFYTTFGIYTSEMDYDCEIESKITKMAAKTREISLTKEEYSLGAFNGVIITVKKPPIVTISQSIPISGTKNSAAKPAFYKQMKGKFGRLTLRLWRVQFSYIVLLVVALSVILTFYFDVFSALDSVSAVNNMGRRRFRTINIVDYLRQLHLHSSGFLPHLNSTATQQLLQQDALDLYEILNSLRNLSQQWPEGRVRDMYSRQVVTVWEQQEESIRPYRVTLLDAMAKFVTAAMEMSLASTVNFSQPAAFYIYRNGLGETLSYLNTSTFAYVDMELGLSSGIVTHLTAVSILIVVFILVVGLIVTGGILLELEVTNRNIWKRLNTISIETLNRRYRQLTEHINVLKGRNYSPVVLEDLHSRRETGRILAKWVVLLLLVQSLGGIGYVCNLTVSVEDYVSTSLSSKIPYMNWMGMRRWLSTYNYFCLRELYLLRLHQQSYYDIVPTSQFIPSLHHFARNISDLYRLTEQFLIYGSENARIRDVGISSRHFSLLYKSPCPELPNMVNCTSSIVSKGVHYALQAYLLDIDAVQEMLDAGFPLSYAEIERVVKYGRLVGQGFSQAAVLYDEDGTDTVRGTISALIVRVVSYQTSALTFSAVVIGWGLVKYRRRLDIVRKIGKFMQN